MASSVLTLAGKAIMWQLLIIVMLTLAYWGLQALVSRGRLAVLWTLFLFVPLALTPYWLQANRFDLFVWIKIYSIMFCVCWAGWLRFTSLGDKPWSRRTIAWLLIANILEALVVDIQASGLAHKYNALAAILLIATLPMSVRHIRMDRASRHQTLCYELPLAWICGYTLWNWTFVYLNYPAYAGHHTAILSAAFIVAWFNPQHWVQARAATLGLNLLGMATSNTETLAVSNTLTWFHESLAMVAASCTLAWLAAHAVLMLKAYLAINQPLEITKIVLQHLERATPDWEPTDSILVS